MFENSKHIENKKRHSKRYLENKKYCKHNEKRIFAFSMYTFGVTKNATAKTANISMFLC